MSHEVSVVRVYDDPDAVPGAARVLVDRVWPRGVSKEAARLDLWLKDVAPSTELRRWFGHDPARFEEFRRRYAAELAAPPTAEAFARLRDLTGGRRVALVTATKDVPHSHATVLAGLLDD
jgi:uncharacterized protein YeaO (DUF488 family)